jgi:predicted RNA-binding protein with PIN domain
VAHIVVDAMNVIGSRPTGWWRDRDGAVRALVGRLRLLAREGGGEVRLFVDGRPIRGLAEGEHDGVHVLYAARRGPNAADDRIVDYVRQHEDPPSLEVVTSDRALAERVSGLGARVRRAGWLLDRLDALEAAAPPVKRRRKHGDW